MAGGLKENRLKFEGSSVISSCATCSTNNLLLLATTPIHPESSRRSNNVTKTSLITSTTHGARHPEARGCALTYRHHRGPGLQPRHGRWEGGHRLQPPRLSTSAASGSIHATGRLKRLAITILAAHCHFAVLDFLLPRVRDVKWVSSVKEGVWGV